MKESKMSDTDETSDVEAKLKESELQLREMKEERDTAWSYLASIKRAASKLNEDWPEDTVIGEGGIQGIRGVKDALASIECWKAMDEVVDKRACRGKRRQGFLRTVHTKLKEKILELSVAHKTIRDAIATISGVMDEARSGRDSDNVQRRQDAFVNINSACQGFLDRRREREAQGDGS